ncbi:MAG: OmpA family protein [Sulfuriferula sp.]
MSPTLRNLVAISCVLMAGSAAAADLDTRTYLTPSISYTTPDNNLWGLDDGFGFGIGAGKAINQNLNLELNAGYSSQDFKNGAGQLQDVSVTGDALYIFNRDASFSPYILGGIGAIQGRTEGHTPGASKTHFMADLGVGAMKWFNDIAVRGDVRYRFIDGKGDATVGNDWIATLGLMIPLGAKPAAPAPEPAPAPYVAPAPAAAPEPTPAPAAQPEIARPVAHTKVIFDGTNFDFDKATLRPTGKAKLDDNVRSLTQYPDIDVEITGHTDSVGSDKYNQKLSEERAMTVKRYMESKGIASGRMTTKGYGETKPIASNKTKAGRAENRRVEIEIMN